MKSKAENDGRRANALKTVLLVLGDRWKLLIVQSLFSGTKRYNELKSTIPRITSRALSKHLLELEANGLLTRTVTTTGPVQVKYSLTSLGMALEPTCEALTTWAKKFAKHRQTARAKKMGASMKKPPAGSRRKTKRD